MKRNKVEKDLITKRLKVGTVTGKAEGADGGEGWQKQATITSGLRWRVKNIKKREERM
jgi:hypothetical protein